MTTTYIYALCDPGTGNIRYVGKSNAPVGRFKRHKSNKKRGHRTNWIAELKSQGLSPTLEILDAVPISEWQFWEREYIKVFRAIGMDLVNETEGGEGLILKRGADHPCFGRIMPDWQKQALRESKLGKPRSEAIRKKFRNALRGNNKSGTPGVCYDKEHQKWTAYLMCGGKRLYLGRFSILEDAVTARQAALTKVPENKHCLTA